VNDTIIPPRSGTAFRIEKGQVLTVTDVEGVQVADLLAYNADDVREVISNGRTFDYAETILLTPCSEATFRHFYPDQPVHRGCFGNLAEALAPYGVEPDMIPCAFNIFMNVPVAADGKIRVDPPLSKAGDYIRLRAEMDLVIGLAACSAFASNGGRFKPIGYAI
jgi:uncharacterized protein